MNKLTKIEEYIKQYHTINDDTIIFDLSYYHDIRYPLSDEIIRSLLEYAGYIVDEDNINDDLENSLYDLLYDIIKTVHPDIDDSEQHALYDELIEKYSIRYDVDHVLNANKPSDLVLYFGSNWDDDYHNEACWHDLNINELEDQLESSIIPKLIKTQGYSIHDLFDEKMRNSSVFLSSLYEELYDYKTDLSGMQLIAIPNSTDWKTICEIENTKRGIIKAGTNFGLFNRIMGSGSGLSIITEKDLSIEDLGLYEVSPFYLNNYFNYSPEVVYGGFIRSNEEQLFTM